MNYNNKAQNITKPYTIIFIMIVIATISIMTLEFGRDVASTPDNNLNDESLLYIYASSGFTPSANITSNDADELFFSSDLNTSGSTLDFALEFQFYREQSSSWRVITQDLWNVPTFFVSGFGLDLYDWRVVLTFLNTVIWAIIFYVVIRLVRGLL